MKEDIILENKKEENYDEENNISFEENPRTTDKIKNGNNKNDEIKQKTEKMNNLINIIKETKGLRDNKQKKLEEKKKTIK